MGGELAQYNEWDHEKSLDWHLLDAGPYHRGVKLLVADLNRLYRREPAMHQLDHEPAGFHWMDCTDTEQSVVAFCRFAASPASPPVLCVYNFTPVARHGYRVGVPRPGSWVEVVNTDSALYGGSDVGNGGGVPSEPTPWHGQPHSVRLNLPPLGAVIFRHAPA
jgi:1,4-alpha-glucan branching enzyme